MQFNALIDAPRTCEECGKSFNRPGNVSYEVFKERKFCSFECYNSSRTTKVVIGNKLYNHGSTGRNKIADWFGNKCVICGWDEAPCDLAHISGGKDRIENLILLCPNHHRMFDRGKISVDEIRTIWQLYVDTAGKEVNLANAV